MKNVERVLTSGLIAGYAGETQFSETTRGGFKLSSSHLENENETYHDEWLQARVGGGQELVEINGEKFTRLYAGGIVEEKILKKLEISEKEIIDFLKFVIINLKENTRLFEPCSYKNENNWSYNYQILDNDDNLSIITAKESISYKNTVVFLHNFLLCPIS